MMVSDFAPLLPSPVRHKINELHRLLIDSQIQALIAMDGVNADIAGAIYLPSYLLKQLDEFCLPSLFKSVA